MKANKLALRLSLTILVALWGGGAYAKNTPSQNAMSTGDPIQTQNKRQKTLHSDRKAAAVRLKHANQIARANEIHRQGSKQNQGQKDNGGVK